MIDQNGPVDPKIERWHQDFEQLKQIWLDWCRQNATKYETAAQAWGAFVEEQRQNRMSLEFSRLASHLVK